MNGPTLAAVMIGRARRFATIGEHLAPIAPASALHGLAIAIELSLKAAILDRGGTDERNRAEIRHNLRHAECVARDYGFQASPALARLASRLTPYYKDYGFHGLAALAPTLLNGELHAMVDTVAVHVDAVRVWMRAARRRR